MIVFARNVKRFAITCVLFLWFCQPYPEYRGIPWKRLFYRSSNSYAIQLFIPIKGNFSRLFFFRISRSEGEFRRGYLLNIATCTCLFHVINIDLKLWIKACLHCKNPIIKTNSLYCSCLLWTSFSFSAC